MLSAVVTRGRMINLTLLWVGSSSIWGLRRDATGTSTGLPRITSCGRDSWGSMIKAAPEVRNFLTWYVKKFSPRLRQ